MLPVLIWSSKSTKILVVYFCRLLLHFPFRSTFHWDIRKLAESLEVKSLNLNPKADVYGSS